MNERIRALSDNASHYANGVCDANANADWYEIRDQKFGELMVKECANFLKDTLDDQFAAEQLVEHFGVEE